jgi:hypothetical protein
VSFDESVRSEEGERAERRGGVSRRTLLKAGWTVPVIMTVAPSVAFAASGTPPPTKTTVQPTTTTTVTTPSGEKNPGGHHPHTSTPPPGGPSTGTPGTGSSTLPAEGSQGPQPARVDRGFTG